MQLTNQRQSKKTVQKTIILKELMLSIKTHILDSNLKTEYDYFQVIWDSRIRYLKDYKITLEHLSEKLDIKKTSHRLLRECRT